MVKLTPDTSKISLKIIIPAITATSFHVAACFTNVLNLFHGTFDILYNNTMLTSTPILNAENNGILTNSRTENARGSNGGNKNSNPERSFFVFFFVEFLDDTVLFF